jgi:hypothetical protein
MNQSNISALKFGKGAFYDLDEAFKIEGECTKYNLKVGEVYKYYNKSDGAWYRNFEAVTK